MGASYADKVESGGRLKGGWSVCVVAIVEDRRVRW